MKVKTLLKFIIFNITIMLMFTNCYKKGLYWLTAIVPVMTLELLNLENYMLEYVEYYLLNT